MNKEQILELGQAHGLQIEQTKYGDTFISHRNHRIFFRWHPEHQEWVFIVHKTGKEANLLVGYPTLGSNWFKLWGSWSDGIAWGEQLIDCQFSE